MFRAIVLALGLAAAPAIAAQHFQAQPAAAPAADKLIVRDTVWNCAGGACSAGKSSSRPAVVCAALVKEVGPLRSFAVQGRALDAQQLEKCNGRAD